MSIDKIISLMELDELRLPALECVRLLDLPDSYIAAGFVRNLIWNHLHQKTHTTILNDVDVIYFDANELDTNKYLTYELTLKKLMPQLNWQVRNQALMHHKNNDLPYTSILNVMSY